MTKFLELAIAEIRKLPPEAQDETAEMLFWTLEARAGTVQLDEETARAIDEGLAQARRGEFATEIEMSELWKRHGL